MQYFTVSKHESIRLTRVDVRPKAPKFHVTDKSGFVLVLCVALDDEDAEFGARGVMKAMDEMMGVKTKAPGIYQADVREVIELYESIMEQAPEPGPSHSPLQRVMAGVAAVVLLVWTCGVGVWAMLIWLIICGFKNQSGLLTMAETSVVWSIFDCRRLIQHYGRIALGRT
jgi:hypothetical protein